MGWCYFIHPYYPTFRAPRFLQCISRTSPQYSLCEVGIKFATWQGHLEHQGSRHSKGICKLEVALKFSIGGVCFKGCSHGINAWHRGYECWFLSIALSSECSVLSVYLRFLDHWHTCYGDSCSEVLSCLAHNATQGWMNCLKSWRKWLGSGKGYLIWLDVSNRGAGAISVRRLCY